MEKEKEKARDAPSKLKVHGGMICDDEVCYLPPDDSSPLVQRRQSHRQSPSSPSTSTNRKGKGKADIDVDVNGDGDISAQSADDHSDPEIDRNGHHGDVDVDRQGDVDGEYLEMEGRVTVYTISGCGHCKRVKAALREVGIRPAEINLDQWPDRREEMLARTSYRTVPQIFFNEIHIGGAEQLQKLQEEGKLQSYIDLVCKTEAPASAPAPPQIDGCSTTQDDDDLLNVTCEPDKYNDVIQSMRRPVSEGGLCIKNRRYHLRNYRNCFIGREAVDWLLQQKSLGLATRKDAVKFGNRLLKHHHFHHVAFDHPFEDRRLFYRFLQDEDISPKTLNAHSSACAPVSASELSRDIRKLILRLYDEFLSEDGSEVDYDGIASSETWNVYCQRTAELRRVDISSLTREEKLAFYINIYNALVIHAYVEIGPPTRFWQRLTFFSKISYLIGGHVFTLNDIEHGILRANAPPPMGSRSQFGKYDHRIQYCLEQRDPRIHFALVCGAKGCPSIRTYCSSKIDEQLEEATRAYFEGDDALRIDKEKKRIYLTKLLSWYGADFGATPKERLAWVANYAPADKAAAIRELVESNKFKIYNLPYNWSVNSKPKS